jgi:hypothetical protein
MSALDQMELAMAALAKAERQLEDAERWANRAPLGHIARALQAFIAASERQREASLAVRLAWADLMGQEVINDDA